MTKAMLHDELMREAGFETDYEVEREHRRRSVMRAVIALAWLVFVVAVVVQFVDIQSRHRVVPFPVVVAAFIAAPVVHGVIHLLKRRREEAS